MLNKTDRTYIEDVKNPGKVLLPRYDLVLIALRAEKSGHRIPFTPFDDFPLDLGHGPVFEVSSVSESPGVHIACLAYIVNCPIAPSTDRLSSSNRLPSTPRSNA